MYLVLFEKVKRLEEFLLPMKYSIFFIGCLILYFYFQTEKPDILEKKSFSKPVEYVNNYKKVLPFVKGKINEITQENFQQVLKEKKYFILFCDARYEYSQFLSF